MNESEWDNETYNKNRLSEDIDDTRSEIATLFEIRNDPDDKEYVRTTIRQHISDLRNMIASTEIEPETETPSVSRAPRLR